MTALPWTRRPLIGFDLETTGVDVETALIVTASVVRWGGGQLTSVHNWTSNLDGAEIPASATEIHGITTAQARAAGRPAAEVVAQIVETLTMYTAFGWPVVAMNAQFDCTILERECERHGVRSLWDRPPVVLDPRVLDKQMDRFRRGRRRLVDLCQHYGVEMDGGAHNSEVDARAACGVVWKLGERNRTLQRMGLLDLHRAQEVWAREQDASFRAYQFQRTGTADLSPFGWPLVPRPDLAELT
ncbi:exonuclease domain-containing protein [Streptomyces scabiei]|uniref:exonuclease domain-containing protein n=1 Tax=Streptomyces scabiei TaxID=1930 RepID=UPI0038F675D0